MIEQKEYQFHQDLIDRCKVGDRIAQRELYRLYYKAMYNTCFRMLCNSFEAEDVMQESFLAAFMKIDTFNGDLSFGSWLKRIVINKAIDVLRARKIKFEEVNEKLVVENDEPETFISDNIKKVAKIKEAVNLLPEGFRIVFSLALFEGYDHEEIALILKIKESTSRSQLARAKKKLIEYLKDNKDDDLE